MSIHSTVPVRIHRHAGCVVLEDADAHLSLAQALALSQELATWAYRIRDGQWPATRLVYPDGRCLTESTGKPEWVIV